MKELKTLSNLDYYTELETKKNQIKEIVEIEQLKFGIYDSIKRRFMSKRFKFKPETLDKIQGEIEEYSEREKKILDKVAIIIQNFRKNPTRDGKNILNEFKLSGHHPVGQHPSGQPTQEVSSKGG